MFAAISPFAWLFAPPPQSHAPRRMVMMSQGPVKPAGAPPRSKPPRAAPILRVVASSPPPSGETVRRFQKEMLPHLDTAYSFARLLTRGDAAAEDIVHDAYIRALRSFDGFRGESAKAWLMTIVRNCFLSWAKGKGAQYVTTDELENVAEERETAEAALMRAEDASLMQRLIESLPRQLGEIIVLREVEELSYRDIASTLDIPIGTVMSRLARARAALAEAWAKAEAKQ